MIIYVRNLPAATSRDDLADLLEPFGQVDGATVWLSADMVSAVGFVCLPAGGPAAVAALDGRDYRGRPLKVRVVSTGPLDTPPVRPPGPPFAL